MEEENHATSNPHVVDLDVKTNYDDDDDDDDDVDFPSNSKCKT